jgi:hypothetical protein
MDDTESPILDSNPSIPPITYRGPWLAILALVGLDYFSTLAYQPSIAAEAAGPLAPLATAAIVLLTCLGALPVYAYIAGNAPPGQGSMALLEKRIAGWRGKFLILILLGFAATNFVFTRTLSAADAAVHVLNHPDAGWQSTLDQWGHYGDKAKDWFSFPAWQTCCSYWNRQLVTTLLLLAVSFAMWPIVWYGFTRRMVQAALILVGAFVLLTSIILASGMVYVARHPELISDWWAAVEAGRWGIEAPSWAGTDAESLVKMCLWLLPKMALGLSGFEMSLVVMPLVRGRRGDTDNPYGQIANTRKMLVSAALIMGLLLMGSALVTTLLMVPQSLLIEGQARERALAYIAHGGALAHEISPDAVNPLFGRTFGTIYDVVTILVLCLAGASVSVGLRSLMPQFLLRFGMEMRWAYAVGAIYHVINVINLVITMVFQASVEAQRGAYAVSVMAVMSAAAFAVTLDTVKSRRWWKLLLAPLFFAITIVFIVMTGGIVYHHPGSVLISGLFILTVIGMSIFSRWWRAKEFRFEGFEFASPEARVLWDKVRHLEYSVLVPHRPGSRHSLDAKEAKIRKRHRVDPHVPIIFLEVVVDHPSDFVQRPLLDIRQEDARYCIRVSRCVSIAHVIVAIGLEFSKVGEPPEIHFGWADESPLAATLRFLIFGEGNVPFLVHDLLRRHEPDHNKRPRVIIG